jgi:hypothetical protein
VIRSGASLQAAIDKAATLGRTLILAPHDIYEVRKTIIIPPGLRLKGEGTTLVGAFAGPILTATESNWIEGLTFRASVQGVTGIGGKFVRSTARDLQFWTELTYGINVTGLISRITDCGFGLLGPVPAAFQPIKIRSATDEATAWEIDHNAVYNAAGDCAVEVGDGYQLDFHHNNVELNQGVRVAVKIDGMFGMSLHHNWYEANAGSAQVELAADFSGTIGNYVVHVHDNFYNLDGAGNAYVLHPYGAVHVEAYNEYGANGEGKAYSDNPGAVNLGYHHIVGMA